jgi:2-polyprenyl-6-methoxyphenol hydroxylase-like FAD-dependent oxidoreductase
MRRPSSYRSITIVGGGLAGLTLGIGLRQRGLPVILWEAGNYPRHRVCGEFVSGRGLDVLRRFGLLELIENAGARPAYTAGFAVLNHGLSVRDLPEPALCLSRFALDDLLAQQFRQLGGVLRCGERWLKAFGEAGVVRASGRRVQAEQGGWRWYGLKAHAANVTLQADLEMHFAPNSYVGACRLSHGEINICGLFRRRNGDPVALMNSVERLCTHLPKGLSERLTEARWDRESFCSVGGLPSHGAILAAPDECCLGDALAMIPPVTGNGMSMAFESAELAVDPLVAYAEGQADWDTTRRSITQACRNAFGSRLFWAGWLHDALFRFAGVSGLLLWLSRSNFARRQFFHLTR